MTIVDTDTTLSIAPITCDSSQSLKEFKHSIRCHDMLYCILSFPIEKNKYASKTLKMQVKWMYLKCQTIETIISSKLLSALHIYIYTLCKHK